MEESSVHTLQTPSKPSDCDKSIATQDPYIKLVRLTQNQIAFKLRPKCKKQKMITFPCTFCKKTFSQKINAANHEISVHTKQFKYKCFKCKPKKSFVKSSDLKRHDDSVHLKLKHFCPVVDCVKSFTTKYVLTKHVKFSHPN